MQKQTFAVLILGVLLGGFVTYSFVLQTDEMGEMNTAHNHAGEAHDHGHAHGEMLDVASTSAPSLSIESTRISGGNNVDINVSWKNFEMAPENADAEHVAGEGHLHIYVDGHKIGRMYGEWYHVYALDPGEHEIEVTATTNDHRLYTVDGEEVSATTSVTIQ